MATFRIGEIVVARVEDFVDPGVPIKFLLPDLPDEAIARNAGWLAPRFMNVADAARDTRRRILEECCDCNRLLVPGHFAAPHMGRVSRGATGFRFTPGL